MGCAKFMSKLDLFKNSVNFNINGKSKVSSPLGGVFSLLLFAFTTFIIGYNLYHWIIDNQPQVGFQKFYRNFTGFETISAMSINSSMYIGQFPALLPSNFHPIYSNLLSFHTNMSHDLKFQANEAGKIIRCVDYAKKVNPKGNAIWELFSTKFRPVLDFIDCPYFYNSTLEIGGSLFQNLENKALHGEIIYDLCHNKKEGCLVDNKIPWNYTKYPNIFFYNYENREPDITNYENGYKDTASSKSLTLNLNRNAIVLVTLVKTTIKSDKNWIFKFNKDEEIIFYRFKVDVKHYDKALNFKPNYFKVSFNMDIDSTEEIYTRKYKKLDALLAETAAMFSLGFNILNIVHGILNVGYCEDHLIRKVYSFTKIPNNSPKKLKYSVPNANPDSSPTKKGQSSGVNVESSQNSDNLEENHKIENVIEENFEKEFKNVKKRYRKKVIKTKRCLYLISLFCCRKKRNNSNYIKFMTSGIALLKYDLDLVNIIEKLTEYEKLKKILFTSLQRMYLKVLSRGK